MIRLFVVAEPRIPLKDWEVSLLQDIYKYWPRPGIDPQWIKPAKNMNDETIHEIYESYYCKMCLNVGIQDGNAQNFAKILCTGILKGSQNYNAAPSPTPPS